MKLKNVLIVVSNIERSRKYYHDLFGLEMVLDNDGNMILTEGLVLQDAAIWKDFLGKEIVPRSNATLAGCLSSLVPSAVLWWKDVQAPQAAAGGGVTHPWKQS